MGSAKKVGKLKGNRGNVVKNLKVIKQNLDILNRLKKNQ